MLILISDAFDPSLPERLRALGEVTDDKDRLPDAEVVLVRSKTRCDAAYLARAPRLRLIIRGGVGLDNVDLEAARARGVQVANTPEASAPAVAELAMALMLAAASDLPRAHAGMAEGRWLKKEIRRRELYRKTLGLVGIGRIGAAVARRARAFEMEVVAHDAYVTESDVARLAPLDEVLGAADYLSLHTPLTAETRGLIGADALGKVKPGVVVVNTARAQIVDGAAMAAALREGRVGAYATDVWSSDPPPPDDPLLSAPGVLMTPHIGASSRENLGRIGDLVVARIERYLAEKEGGAR